MALDAQNRIWVMTNRRNNASGISVFSSHTYTFDALSRRDTSAREDTTKWNHDYNDRSEPKSAGADADRLPSASPQGADTVGRWQRQLTSGKKLLNSGALIAGTASTYDYDSIGNRLTTTSGGGPVTASGTPGDVGRSVTCAHAITQGQRSFDVIGRYSTATATGPRSKGELSDMFPPGVFPGP